MKEKNVKIGFAIAGAFSAILAVKEAVEMKKMLEKTSEQRKWRAAAELKKLREEWKRQNKNSIRK